MTEEQRIQALRELGAADGDTEALLEYVKNAFQPHMYTGSDECSPNWSEMWDRVRALCQTPPRLEMFESVAGTVPVVYPRTNDDFEILLREIIYKGKGKEMPNMENVGAQFVFGKTLRFIILSNKPYSGVPAERFNLDEQEWLEKSVIIRKHHEAAHYYTKRFLGSSRNNLHDELIADFCGIYAAFGEYRAEWFTGFYDKRAGVYTKNLSAPAVEIIRKLAELAARGAEEWTKTENFKHMDEAGRIEALAKKELLDYTIDTRVFAVRQGGFDGNIRDIKGEINEV